MLIWIPGLCLASTDAEIVFLSGKGERKDSEPAPWAPAAVKHLVKPNGFVRTLANSQMGLLLPDRTQLRLNQNSQMQIKSVADAAAFTQNSVRLSAGRAWSQARPQTAPGPEAAQRKTPAVNMETPAATLAVRGTDWEVEILPDGSTQLVVLSGTVEMANEQGSIEVGPGAAALAAPGKAPVRIQLVDPKERVQWISSWQPQPRRWAGAALVRFGEAVSAIEAGNFDAATALLQARLTDPAAALIAADLRIAQGDLAGAIGLLRGVAAGGSGEPSASALLARALARTDRIQEGREIAEAGLRRHPAHVELLLARGELAILDGDVGGARDAYAKVLAVEPKHPEAWYGIGLIESERENVGLARLALDQALASDPAMSRARAEQAAVETLAGNLAQGRTLLEALIAAEPANYQAHTALGINQLKSGDAQGALDSFLKAGTIEPRYARAWLYSGIAFYQLDDRRRAVEAFRKASELDMKDPLPHLLDSMVLADGLDYGASIAAARRARELLPYLRSLNQVANDQKGSANLGSAFANFGLEEWAGYYASASYSPFWAGSHFFQADRHTGRFSKNSSLYKGFLTDPTAFGASNRKSSLIAVPGHYAKAELILERAEWKQAAAIGTVNGLMVDKVPMAYFASGDLSAGDSREDRSAGRGRNFTLGYGIMPRHDFGLFAFATDTNVRASLRTPELADDALVQRDVRVDAGANLKLAPQNQLWFKAGSGRQSADVSGRFIAPATAAALNSALRTTIIGSNGALDRFHTDAEFADAQMRHSFGNDDRVITWGAELAQLRRPGEMVATFAPARLRFAQEQTLRSTDLYVSGRWKRVGAFDLQGDLWAQSSKLSRTDLSTLSLLPAGPNFVLANTPRQANTSELNPRLGAAWNLLPDNTLRAVGQRWRRTAAVGTLADVDTAGVPVNDRLPMAGGLYSRARLQYDAEAPGRHFFQLFLDHERIDNGVGGIRSVVPNIELTQLEALRNRRDVFTAVSDIEETPQFVEGRVNTFGVAGNALIGGNQALAMRYLRRENRQTGTNSGRAIPYVPRDMFRVASNWTLPDRWLLGANATYRSQRFRDDLNRDPLASGWAFGLIAYWESADKRYSMQGILDNLLPNKAAGIDNRSHLQVRFAYKL